MRIFVLTSFILMLIPHYSCAQNNSLYYDLESAFSNSDKVKEIILWDYIPYSLPDSLDQFVNLERLTINWAYLEELPETLGELKELKYLDLESDGLESLPSSICKLSKLEVLKVSDNDLTDIPHYIGDLKKLKTVDFSYNNLDFESIPKSFWTLENLEIINFGRTGIDRLPTEFSSEKNLKLLILPRGCKQLKKQMHLLQKRYPDLKVKWKG